MSDREILANTGRFPCGPMRHMEWLARLPPASSGCTGGAFAFGDLDMREADWVARELAAHSINVVSVFYRLAPPLDYAARGAEPWGEGVHFPVPLGHSARRLCLDLEHAVGFGIGPARLGLAVRAQGRTLRLLPRCGRVTQAVPSLARYCSCIRSSTRYCRSLASPELASNNEQLPAEACFSPETVSALNLNSLGDEVGS